jgi:hypothetical protein
MDDSLQAQISLSLSRLDGLIRRGGQLLDRLRAHSSDFAAIAATRAWQEECGEVVAQLSGGSKAHWLARSFSEAFLMRSAAGHAVPGAEPSEIVKRLLAVLEQAVASLCRMDSAAVHSASSEAPPRRFEFVHNPELRPVVEQAYRDSQRAFEQGRYDDALHISCGILEAIVTDALEHNELNALARSGAPAGPIAQWSFEARVAVAEKAGLIGGGFVRLPAIGWAYRDHKQSQPVSERQARRAGQVLRVVMRDLDPGR